MGQARVRGTARERRESAIDFTARKAELYLVAMRIIEKRRKRKASAFYVGCLIIFAIIAYAATQG